jgi:glycosyltransferase involved in cell wall biosynthesis
MAPSKINILFLIPHMGLGGAQKQVISIAKHLDKERFTPFIYSMQPENFYKVETSKLNFQSCDMIFEEDKLSLFSDFVEQNEIHLIVHQLLDPKDPVVFNIFDYLGKKNIPSVEIIHSVVTSEISGHKICVSKAAKKVQKYPSEVYYLGIDTSEKKYVWLSKSIIRAKRKISPFAYVALYTGRIEKDKGFMDIKEIAAELGDICFLCVGSVCADSLVKDLPSNILLISGEEDVSDYYTMSDIYIHPSYADAFPNSVLEAMLHRLPVIAYDIGGLREQIDNCGQGYIIPLGQTGVFKEKINELRQSSKKSKEYGCSGRKKVLSLFDMKNNIKGLEDIFTGLSKRQSLFYN